MPRSEIGELMRLAIPLALAQLAQMLMAITDAVMLGRLDSVALAAGGLAAGTTFTLLMTVQGVLMGIQPLVAHARGRGDPSTIARTVAAGLVFGLGVSLPMMLLLLRIDRFMLWIGEPAPVAAYALVWERVAVWMVPVAMVGGVYRSYLTALERGRMISFAMVLGLVTNGLLNYGLVFGHFGLPVWGIAGSAAASVAAQLLVTLVMVLAARRWPVGLAGVRLAALGQGLRQLLHQGWPIAGTLLVEIALFNFTSLLMGRFGEIAIAANQIVLNIASLIFMVPLAIGHATTVRVGLHLGAGRPLAARRTGFVALACGVGFTSMSAIGLSLGAASIFDFYLDRADPRYGAILALGTPMIMVAALFQLFDGAQAVASGALRGLKDSRAAMLAAAVGYWGIGMPVGIGLGFGLGLGPVGLWWGLAGGLASVAILLTLRFRQRTGQLVAAG